LTPFVQIAGGAAAGSRHVLGSSDADVEKVRLILPDNCVEIIVVSEQGNGTHPWSTMLQINAGTDYIAYDNFNNRLCSALVGPGDTHIIKGDDLNTLDILASAAVSATTLTGRVWVFPRVSA